MVVDSLVPLPDKRSATYFNEGDKVAVALKGEWYFGVVRAGYRHHDGCVSYILKGIGPQGDEDDFEGYWGCGIAWPGLLKIEEFDFFKRQSDVYVQWYEEAKERDYNSKWEFTPINKEDLALYAKYVLSV